MQVTQIYSLMNDITKEILGTTAIVKEDLSNVVDIGKAIFNATSVDNYVKKLLNHIGRVIFVNRVYRGTAPNVLMDGWEYGSVCEKITSEMPTMKENKSWSLVDGQTYNQDIFHAPKASAKFYNKRITFEADVSFTEMQVKESFSSVDQLNAFFAMIQTQIENAMTVNMDALVERTINNFIAQTVLADYADGTITATDKIRTVNLLHLYNTKYNTTLTQSKALTDPGFIRFTAFMMELYRNRMRKMSTLFNIGGMQRFTDDSDLHIVMLSDFALASDIYLQSDTFHNNFVKLPTADIIPYWQGSGTTYSVSDITKINVTIESGETTKDITVSGIIGVMFDRDALGVSNLSRRTTTHYNASAEFFTNFYKFDAGYFNDFNENFVVFLAEEV